MTKKEVQALIKKKISDTELDHHHALIRKDIKRYSYYNGVKKGLQDALQIIGMLDNEHNRLKSSV